MITTTPETVMTESNWRELCAELTGWIERATRHYISDPDVLIRARAALAQPEPEVAGPTDEELLGLDELEESWNAQADAANSWDELGIDEIIVWAQRQALARWSRPAPPAEVEVAELVAWLRLEADDWSQANPSGHQWARLTRAADLLEQRHPAPVPVSERLPGPEDCDAEGRCWLFSKVEKEWRLIDAANPGVPHLKYCFSHWLHATVLPIPAWEVE